MALSLAACGGSSTTSTDDTSTDDTSTDTSTVTVNSFTLTDDDDTGVAGDVIAGSVGENDVVTGVAGDLDAADIIVDTDATDADSVTVAIDADAVQYSISGFESINLSLDVLRGTDATIDATNISGATITASSSRVGFDGVLDVLVLGTNNLTAGTGIETIVVTDMGDGSVLNAGSADDITVDTTATDETSSNKIIIAGDVDLDFDFDTAAAADVVSLEISSDVDAEVSIAADELTFATSLTNANQATLSATGSGAITLAVADADEITGLTVTGFAAVEVSGNTTGALDIGDIDGPVTLTTADTTDISAVNGKVINAAKTDLDLTITGGDTSGESATLNVSGLQDGGSVTTVDLATANINFAADVVEVLDLVLDGAAVVTVAADIDFKDIDDSVATSSMTVSGAFDVTVTDSSLQTFNAASLTGVLDYTQSGTDDLTLTSGAGDDDITVTATATAVITTGSGDDAVSALVIGDTASDDLVVDLGAGDDTVTVDDTFDAGTLTVIGGDGTDTLVFADANAAVDLQSTTLNLTSVEQIDVEGGGVDFLASHLSGKTYKFIGEGSGDLINIYGTTAADTVDLSGLTFDATIANALTNTVIDLGTGSDTITLSAAADTIFSDVVGTDGITTLIGFDTDDDVIDTGNAIDADGDVVDATSTDFDTGNVDLAAALAAVAVAHGDATDTDEKAIVFNYGGDQYVLITDETDGDAYSAAADNVFQINGVDVDDLTAAHFI